jgi:hypothetical protein
LTESAQAKNLCVSGPRQTIAFAPGSMSDSSPPLTAARARRTLIEAGFEVFRTRGEEILLAERPRENLIMDSGVRLRLGEPLEVRVVLRAQKADFPNDDEAFLFDRVRKLAAPALTDGFAEIGTSVTPVTDPGDAERTLDTFYEITYAKSAGALEQALVVLKFAMGLEKRA